MPLFRENAQSVSMIKHAMIITKTAIQHLNRGQVPVIAMDQPLYALAKQIQWPWPDQARSQKSLLGVLFEGNMDLFTPAK